MNFIWLGLLYPLQYLKNVTASILMTNSALFCFLYNIIHSDFAFFTFFDDPDVDMIFKFPDFLVTEEKGKRGAQSLHVYLSNSESFLYGHHRNKVL